MKGIWLVLLVAGCAVKAAPVTPIAATVAETATAAGLPLALLGLPGAAHACPLLVDGVGHVVTASHVAWRLTTDGMGQEVWIPNIYLIEGAAGQIGLAMGEAHHLATDLSYLQTDLELTEWYARGNLPAVGDVVTWVEYDFSKPERAYQPKARSSKVLGTRLSHIFLKEVPESGASGTCVFNAAGEVVGIIAWRQRVGMDEIGVAVGVSVLE